MLLNLYFFFGFSGWVKGASSKTIADRYHLMSLCEGETAGNEDDDVKELSPAEIGLFQYLLINRLVPLHALTCAQPCLHEIPVRFWRFKCSIGYN